MALTESQVLATELEKVVSKIPQAFERDDTFYSLIAKTPVEVISSRDMRIPLELRPGGNFGFYNPDGGGLGRGDGPTFDKGVISAVHTKFGIEWTKKAEWSTDDTRKSVQNTFKNLMAKSMAEFRRNNDSLCMGAGDGVIGTITSVSNSGGKDTYTCTTDGFGTRLMRYGQWVAVYNTGLTANRTITPSSGSLDGIAGQIDFIDYAAKQVRIKGAAGSVVAGDKLVWNGLSGSGPVSLYGVQYHHSSASTGNWLGLDRATYPEVRATEVAAGGALALSHARLAGNKKADRLGRDQMGKVRAFMHPCQQQAYEELGQLVQVINKTASKTGLDLYFDGQLQMAGMPIEKHFSWDKKRIDIIDPSDWGRAELKAPGFYDVEGRKIFEVRDAATGGVVTSQIFYLVASWNLFIKNPAAGCYISGLTVPSGY